MRIAIDMQGVQSTANRNRGIGRYALALSKKRARLRGEHEVILALNGLFPDTVESIRAAFAGVLPDIAVRVWEAVGPVSATDRSNDARRLAAEMSREAFIASLHTDIVLNTSLFEGLNDDAITSVGSFTSQLPTAVLLYDLTPLIYRSMYLQNPENESWYLNKIDHLRRADLLLSISASSRQEAVDYLGFPPEKVVNISTACESHFRPVETDNARHVHLQKNYGLIRPFLMYTGGVDRRKNIEGLICAYASMPRHIREAHQLAVVCSIDEADKRRLLQLANEAGLGDDELVDAWPGDIFLGLDLQQGLATAQKDFLLEWHRRGIKVFFVVYDLLPILFPHFFLEGSQTRHERWLEAISHFDGAVCISRAVANELHHWLQTAKPKRSGPFGVHCFHLGADVENSVPTKGCPKDAEKTLLQLSACPSFLMVGTIEPRKGHLQTLDAFSQLWLKGLDINLVIVGKEGWKGLPEDTRRSIPEIVKQLRHHPERGKRLFWLEGISDEYLEKVYVASTCLIAASYGEGFGLPIIEAAQHKLPIIARDIPVFREVAGEHAFYFTGFEPQALTDAVRQWIELHKQGKTPRPDNIPRLTWKQSAEQLMKIVLGGQWWSSPLGGSLVFHWGRNYE